jgi:murein DD-endopeptidase MepM/ murein hydrolase activator NlpD
MQSFLRWVALVSALVACSLNPAWASIADYPFRLVTRSSNGEQVLVAHNDGPASITVHITLSGENYASDRTWPQTAVVPPYTWLPLGRVFAADKNAGGYNFLFKYSHHFGRYDAQHDPNAAYRLPFLDGQAYTVSQAYGGRLTSHNNRENLYAVDFSMPTGTPIVAARAGVVVDVTLSHTEGGYDMRFLDKANTIVIAHDDGTVAEYAHLSPGEPAVRVGQRVAAGDYLGVSGSTGYSSGPHLHFIVSRPAVVDGKVSRLSVPVQFYDGDPNIRFSVAAGTTLMANYGSTDMPSDSTPVENSVAATGLTSQGPQVEVAP